MHIAPTKVAVALVALLGSLALVGLGRSGVNTLAESKALNRGQVLDAIKPAEAVLNQNPDNADARFKLANLHYQAGHFETAQTLLNPLLEAKEPALEAVALMAELQYLSGKYAESERTLQQAMQRHPDDLTVQVVGRIKLGFVYYQTNQFKKALECVDFVKNLQARGGKISYPGLEQMIAFGELLRSFGDQPLYQIDWNGSNKDIVPFLLRDPLPVLPVEINGKPIYVFIDTGGAMFILDPEIASNLGIKSVATYTGTYAGGLTNETGFARAESLKVGGIALRNVPVMLLPTQKLTTELTGGQYTIGGIIGTNVLQQFLATIDYPDGKLILRPRTEVGRAALDQELTGRAVIPIPFYLSQTHFMVATGSLNGQTDLMLNLDSGLATDNPGGPSFAAPIQTLEYLGIPVPDTSSGGSSGGAGVTSVGSFPLTSGGLGSLVRKDVSGSYGSMTPARYWEQGFILDGIISHNFLRNYAWTIDFDTMQMFFAPPN